jgi:hypothetical protein
MWINVKPTASKQDMKQILLRLIDGFYWFCAQWWIMGDISWAWAYANAKERFPCACSATELNHHLHHHIKRTGRLVRGWRCISAWRDGRSKTDRQTDSDLLFSCEHRKRTDGQTNNPAWWSCMPAVSGWVSASLPLLLRKRLLHLLRSSSCVSSLNLIQFHPSSTIIKKQKHTA